MTLDDLPPTRRKPRTRMTIWWVLGLVVIALAVAGALSLTRRHIRAPAEAHTRTMSRSPTELPVDAPP